MSDAKRKPWVGRDPCVTVTTKQFDKASGKRVRIELRALRVGQEMVVAAIPGQVVELKVLLHAAKGAGRTELRLEVSDYSSSLPDARRTHGTLA